LIWKKNIWIYQKKDIIIYMKLNKNTIPNYIIDWTDKYFHHSYFDKPINYPSKKVINFFKKFYIPSKIILYRGKNKYNKQNNQITSWTYDKKVASRYIKKLGGKIIKAEFTSEKILLDTTFLTKKEKIQLGYDYKIDDKEVLILTL